MKKRALLALLLAVTLLLAALAGCSDPAAGATASAAPTGATAEPTAEPAFPVAIIFDGTITDGGWNQDGYNAIMELADEYNLDVSYQENVSSTDAADVIRNYANDGYKLIIDNEQYHCEIMAEIAPEFPDVTFACVNGYVSADNMISITGDMWQHIYLAGIISGAVTTSNKLGLITYSTNSNSALTMLAAYSAGAKYANPDAEVIHVATGSFSDLAIGKEMAISLIDQGCDVILCNSGDCNVTVMETCAEKSVYSIGSILDNNGVSADYVLGSAMLPPSNILRLMVEGYLNGSLTGSPDVKVLGIAEGIEEFRVNPTMKSKLDASVFTLLDQGTADIESGKVTIELP